jgi:hypothetical protein
VKGGENHPWEKARHGQGWSGLAMWPKPAVWSQGIERHIHAIVTVLLRLPVSASPRLSHRVGRVSRNSLLVYRAETGRSCVAWGMALSPTLCRV